MNPDSFKLGIRMERPKTGSFLLIELNIAESQEVIVKNQTALSQAVDNYTRKWFPDWEVITYGRLEDFYV